MLRSRLFWAIIGYQSLFLFVILLSLAATSLFWSGPREEKLAQSKPLALSKQISPPDRQTAPNPPGTMSLVKFPKWRSVIDRRWANNLGSESFCLESLRRSCQLGQWQGFLEKLRGESERTQISKVNQFINRVSYRSDRSAWGQVDYWATPGEFFAAGGDCEDYAIAKYFSLRELGIPASRMRIVVMYDKKRRLSHAALVIKRDGEDLLLDNVSDKIVTWNQISHYRQIYSVNERSARLYLTQNAI